jgi:beta-glucosidase
MVPSADPTFPDGFAWGVSTSSYQIEGAVAVDGRGASIWDTFARVPGAVADGTSGDVACDHYHRLEEDLDLLAWLGVDAYRFSIAWPRVLPDGVHLEPRGLAFYDRLVDGLLARGIEPLATLYHWDLPQPLEDRGGWASRETVDRFVAYARVVADHLGDRVRRITTLNEPWVSAFLGYDLGVHAPGVRDPARAIAAVHHLLLAHGRSSATLRGMLAAAGGDEAQEAELSIVLNLAPVRPIGGPDDDADGAAVRLHDGIRNRIWLDPLLHGRYPDDVLAVWEPIADLSALHRPGDLDEVVGSIDLLGINYYHPQWVGARRADRTGPRPAGPGQAHLVEDPGPPPYTEMGWAVDASGLEDLLRRLHRDAPGLPLAVTENGGAFPDREVVDGRVADRDRITYLTDHLAACSRAIAAGVDLRGYFVWTLLDNFEWAEGYRPRFGIVHVDRDTLDRTPKASAHWYRDLLAAQHAGAARSSR